MRGRSRPVSLNCEYDRYWSEALRGMNCSIVLPIRFFGREQNICSAAMLNSESAVGHLP